MRFPRVAKIAKATATTFSIINKRQVARRCLRSHGRLKQGMHLQASAQGLFLQQAAFFA